jgi:hypothetical protein
MLRLSMVAFVMCFSAVSIGASDFAASFNNVPESYTPRKLQEAWLSFHRKDMCQEVDALFVFKKSGLEVWSSIESDKIVKKFQALFGYRQNSYPVELYITRPPVEKRSDDENDPPPSLWQNYELRSNLGDQVASVIMRLDPDEPVRSDAPLPDSMLKQQLKIYADETLTWNRRMERYALDLVALTRVAFDPGMPPDFRSKTMGVCATHAGKLEKYIRKLASNLSQALPISEKTEHASSKPGTSVKANQDPVERAEKIADDARAVSRRMVYFIHPEHHTVELDELRHPSLFESLMGLRRTVTDFRKLLAQPIRK